MTKALPAESRETPYDGIINVGNYCHMPEFRISPELASRVANPKFKLKATMTFDSSELSARADSPPTGTAPCMKYFSQDINGISMLGSNAR